MLNHHNLNKLNYIIYMCYHCNKILQYKHHYIFHSYTSMDQYKLNNLFLHYLNKLNMSNDIFYKHILHYLHNRILNMIKHIFPIYQYLKFFVKTILNHMIHILKYLYQYKINMYNGKLNKHLKYLCIHYYIYLNILFLIKLMVAYMKYNQLH